MKKTKTAAQIMDELKRARLVKLAVPENEAAIPQKISMASRRAIFGPDCDDADTFNIAGGIYFLQMLRAQNKNGQLDEKIRAEEATTAPLLLAAAVDGKLPLVTKAHAAISNSPYEPRWRTPILCLAYMKIYTATKRAPKVREVFDEMKRVQDTMESNGTLRGWKPKEIWDTATLRKMLISFGFPFSEGKRGRPREKRRQKSGSK